MTNIAKELRTYLLSKTAITDLVGPRIYYSHLPQRATIPALVLDVVTSTSERHLSDTEGVARTEVQIDCYGSTYTAAVTLGETVRKYLDTHSGALGAITADEVIVQSHTDAEDAPTDGSDAFRYLRTLDVIVWHTEDVPVV